MRRCALIALAFAACAPPNTPPDVALPPTPAAGATSSTPSEPCIVAGAGELVEGLGRPFAVFASPRATKRGLELRDTKTIAVSWSDFPPLGENAGPNRAAIALGGQKLLRVHAFAELAGRGFQLRAPAYAVPNHVWLESGVPVEVMGTAHGGLVVRRKTPFASPTFLEAPTRCADVAYAPTALVPAAEESAFDETAVGLVADRVVLRAAPRGEEVFRIVPGGYGFAFSIRAHDAGWAKVVWHGAGLGVEGWVQESELGGEALGTIGLGNVSTGPGPATPPRRVRVVQESPVLLGDERAPFADAVFEVGAVLEAWSARDGALLVRFPKRAIVADDGMWVAESAVETL